MTISKMQKNTFIFTLWTLLYFLWFRWYMQFNWDFDIFRAEHWQYIANQWWYGGWIITGSYYWLFLLSLFLCLPVWILGMCWLMSINYTHFFEKFFWDLIYNHKTKKVQNPNKRVRVTKKKSYKEIRPRPLASTPQTVAAPQAQAPAQTASKKAVKTSELSDLFMQENALPATSFSHRAVSDDFEGASPFETAEFKGPDFETETTRQPLDEDFDAIMQAADAYVIAKPHLGKTTLDYAAVGKGEIFIILKDSEKGDWLADEERFNDEDPLWFSETSHRISPITTLKKFEKSLTNALKKKNISMAIHPVLAKTDGNIINAEDMQEVWKEMKVSVCRSGTGMPEDLPSFTDTFPKKVDIEDVDVIEQVREILTA